MTFGGGVGLKKAALIMQGLNVVVDSVHFGEDAGFDSIGDWIRVGIGHLRSFIFGHINLFMRRFHRLI